MIRRPVHTSLALLAAALLTPAAARGQPQHGDAPTVPAPTTPPPDASAPISPTPPAVDKPADASASDAAKRSEPAKPLPRASVLEDVAGTVREVDRKAHRIVVDAPGGPVTLTLDRNTLVYGPRGLVTPFEVRPGAQVRVGRNAEFVAYWVAVRAPQAGNAVSTPDQGTGPGGGAGPPAEPNSGPGGGAPPSSTVGPGSVTPGAAAPPSGGPGPGR
jgi:hypothetical protein